MKTLLILTSLTLASTALANPSAPTPAPPPPPDARMVLPRCTPSGAPVFEIDQVPIFGRDNGFPTSEAKLFPNGTWSIVEHTSGAITRQASGCVDPRLVGAVAKMLEAAPWRTERNGVACAAISTTKTVYKLRGVVTYEAIVCGDQRLDAASAAHVADAQLFLDTLTAPPVPPPCCKR